MTNLKQTTFVFAFAALLFVMPLATPNAVATEGQANLLATCGFDIPPAIIDMGTLIAGSDGSEVEVTLIHAGSGSTYLEVVPLDWFGTGVNSTGTIIINSPVDGDIVSIGDTHYEANGSGSNVNFAIGSGATANDDTATNLAAAINGETATTNITATFSGNEVYVEYGTPSTAGDVDFDATTNGSGIIVSGSTLTGGTDPEVHLDASVTKYDYVNNGATALVTSDYTADKVSVGASSNTHEVFATSDPDHNVVIQFQLSADGTLLNMPYSGALTQDLTFTYDCTV